METITLEFGKHKDKTLIQVAQEDPQYILWLSGSVTKFSMKKNVQISYQMIQQDYPDIIRIIKEFVAGCVCKICLVGDCTRNQACKNSKITTRNYHYHPYGKRS